MKISPFGEDLRMFSLLHCPPVYKTPPRNPDSIDIRVSSATCFESACKAPEVRAANAPGTFGPVLSPKLADNAIRNALETQRIVLTCIIYITCPT